MFERRKELFMLSLFLIAGFISTSLASYFVSLNSVRNQLINTELPITSDNIYSEIQNDLLRPVFISSLMASDTFLHDWVVTGEKDIRKIEKYLNEINTEFGTFTSFFVSEKTGNYYHPSGILKKIEEGSARDEWYFRVRDMKHPYEINVDIDMANNDEMVIFINYRVTDYLGNFIGATGVGLKVSSVNKVLLRYHQKYNSQIYFLDTSGRVKLSNFELLHINYDLLKNSDMKEVTRRILSKESDNFQYERNGVTIYLNSRFIPEFKWYLVVERSNENVERVISNTFILNLFICLIITVIVLSINVFIIRKYQIRLENLAGTDRLTGVDNRLVFDLVGPMAVKDVNRNGIKYSMIMFDVDNFKSINDFYDHITGDEVLKQVSMLTRNSIREIDQLFRWGGDEFIIILKNCDVDNAYNIAENIRKKTESSNFFFKSKKLHVTLSMGVTEFVKDESLEACLKKSDILLLKAKSNGKNRVEKE